MCVILCAISGACDMVNFSGPKTVSEPFAEREPVPSSWRGWEASRPHHHVVARTAHFLRIYFTIVNNRDEINTLSKDGHSLRSWHSLQSSSTASTSSSVSIENSFSQARFDNRPPS
jgi:hypothetical protein